jgi:hypothetical protein
MPARAPRSTRALAMRDRTVRSRPVSSAAVHRPSWAAERLAIRLKHVQAWDAPNRPAVTTTVIAHSRTWAPAKFLRSTGVVESARTRGLRRVRRTATARCRVRSALLRRARAEATRSTASRVARPTPTVRSRRLAGLTSVVTPDPATPPARATMLAARGRAIARRALPTTIAHFPGTASTSNARRT